MKIVLALAGAVVLFDLYVRFAPSDPARWHVTPPDRAKRFRTGLVEILPGDDRVLAALDRVARGTPRTTVLAGSVADGRITYVTRSRLWGFPDYVTIDLSDGRIAIYARARFGGSDSGVNAARVADWLQRLEAVQE